MDSWQKEKMYRLKKKMYDQCVEYLHDTKSFDIYLECAEGPITDIPDVWYTSYAERCKLNNQTYLPRIWFDRVVNRFREEIKTVEVDLATQAGRDLFQLAWSGKLPEQS